MVECEFLFSSKGPEAYLFQYAVSISPRDRHLFQENFELNFPSKNFFIKSARPYYLGFHIWDFPLSSRSVMKWHRKFDAINSKSQFDLTFLSTHNLSNSIRLTTINSLSQNYSNSFATSSRYPVPLLYTDVTQLFQAHSPLAPSLPVYMLLLLIINKAFLFNRVSCLILSCFP